VRNNWNLSKLTVSSEREAILFSSAPHPIINYLRLPVFNRSDKDYRSTISECGCNCQRTQSSIRKKFLNEVSSSSINVAVTTSHSGSNISSGCSEF
jgi:hypothetical protein